MNNQDLILKMWNSLTRDKVGQVSVMIIVVGIMVALIFCGLGLLAHILIGTSMAWSAISSIAAGSGTDALTYGITRRRQRPPELRDDEFD